MLTISHHRNAESRVQPRLGPLAARVAALYAHRSQRDEAPSAARPRPRVVAEICYQRLLGETPAVA